MSLPVAVQGLQLQPGLLEQWSDLIAQQVAVEEAPLQRFATLVRPGSPRPPLSLRAFRRPFPSHLARGCSVCPERCTYTAPREEVPGYTTCQSDAIEAIVRAPPLSLPLSLRIADRPEL